MLACVPHLTERTSPSNPTSSIFRGTPQKAPWKFDSGIASVPNGNSPAPVNFASKSSATSPALAPFSRGSTLRGNWSAGADSLMRIRGSLRPAGFRRHVSGRPIDRRGKGRWLSCGTSVSSGRTKGGVHPRGGAGLSGASSSLLTLVIEAAEDHFARGRLMHRSDDDVHCFVDHFARAVHDDHRAVIKVRHALVVFLSLAQNEYAHRLARQHDGLECVGKRSEERRVGKEW